MLPSPHACVQRRGEQPDGADGTTGRKQKQQNPDRGGNLGAARHAQGDQLAAVPVLERGPGTGWTGPPAAGSLSASTTCDAAGGAQCHLQSTPTQTWPRIQLASQCFSVTNILQKQRKDTEEHTDEMCNSPQNKRPGLANE